MNSDQHSTHDKVAEFHRVFSMAINQPAGRSLRTLRARLIAEEANEVTAELACGSLTAIAQELADLVYVAYGTAVSLGIDLDAAITAVHQANMAKLDANGQPIYRSDGKVIKPAGWLPPDMTAAISGAL